MNIFLPIAQMSVSVPVIFACGGVVGLLSGLFGVGGGFLLTPLLMFLGISPAVAAASDAAAIVAGSTTGTLEHSRGRTVDYKMGFWLFVGGSVGSVVGVELIHWLNRFGPANSAIRILYLVMLGVIGGLMLVGINREMAARRVHVRAEVRAHTRADMGRVPAIPGSVS